MKKQYTVLRRAAALLSSTLLFAVFLFPCFVQPAAAYDAQGETSWFITDKVYMNGQYYYEITPWADGSLYYSKLTFYNLDQTMTNIAVNVPGEGDGYFGRMLIFMESTLQIPRSGFYVDEDWYVYFEFGDAYGGDYRVALIDTSQWPVCYYQGVASSSVASRVYSLYCHHDDNNDWSAMGVPADAYGDYMTKIDADAMELYIPTAVMNSVGTNLNTETILVKKSCAGGYSADIVPIVWGPASSDEWEYGELELAYKYFCPVSKLGEYEIGDAFPRSEELDTDAILNALDNVQLQYVDAMQYVGRIDSSDLIGFSSMMDSANSAADTYFDQTVGTVDAETISPWFVDNPFMSVIGMIVCIGFVGMVLKKAVT